MKKLTLILGIIALFCFSNKAYSQIKQYIGTPNSEVVIRGRLSTDSLFILPYKDTSKIGSPIREGSIVYQKSDKSIYYYDGSTWKKLMNKKDVLSLIDTSGSGIDTTSLSSRIDKKLDISDTTNKWLPIGTPVGDSAIYVDYGIIKYILNKDIHLRADTFLLATNHAVHDSLISVKIDTTSLSNRIDQKLNIQDTTNKWVNKLNMITINGISKPLGYNPSFTVIGQGGMQKSTYDPNGIEKDVFDYNNMYNTPTPFSGSYNDLTDKPTIPTDNSQLGNSRGFIDHEEDTIALHKTITVNGVTKELSDNPEFTIQGGGSDSIIAVKSPITKSINDKTITLGADTSVLFTHNAFKDSLDKKLVVDTTDPTGALYDIKSNYGINVSNGENTVINQDVTLTPDTTSSNGLVTKYYLSQHASKLDTTQFHKPTSDSTIILTGEGKVLHDLKIKMNPKYLVIDRDLDSISYPDYSKFIANQQDTAQYANFNILGNGIINGDLKLPEEKADNDTSLLGIDTDGKIVPVDSYKGYVRKKDSTVNFVTPTQLGDSLSGISGKNLANSDLVQSDFLRYYNIKTIGGLGGIIFYDSTTTHNFSIPNSKMFLTNRTSGFSSTYSNLTGMNAGFSFEDGSRILFAVGTKNKMGVKLTNFSTDTTGVILFGHYKNNTSEDSILSTDQSGNLQQINLANKIAPQIHDSVSGLAKINDAASSTSTTYSSDKINSLISDAGGGTVTSVGLSLPSSVFNVTGSPVTSSGTLAGAFKSQTANTVFAAPNGSNGAPTFRSLVGDDIPNLPASKITGLSDVATSGDYGDLSGTPSTPTLQQVATEGNTYTGSIGIGSSTDPTHTLEVTGDVSTKFLTTSEDTSFIYSGEDGSGNPVVKIGNMISNSAPGYKERSLAVDNDGLTFTSTGATLFNVDAAGLLNMSNYVNNGHQVLSTTDEGQVKLVDGGLQRVTHYGNLTDSSIRVKKGSDSVIIYSNGNVFLTGHLTAVGGGGTGSDIRLKDTLSIEPIHVLNNLHTVMFRYKYPGSDTALHIGYIAQEVMKYMPQAVRKMPNGYYSVDYQQVHTAAINDLIQVVKKQQEEIDELKKEVEDLKKK